MSWSVDHAADPVRSTSWWNLPNALTVLRLLLVPVFAWLLLRSSGADADRVLAAVVFLVASVTDWADGALARRLGIVTTFGKVADPIADKALTGTALVLLSVLGDLPWWVTVVILVREIGVTLLRFWVIRHGVIAASHGGKIKTALQILAIVWYLWPLPPVLAQVGPWIMALAVLVTIVTGLDYVVRALRLRRRSAPPAG
jgi:CDP-diacylglycerol--glycerol-3-phosphate 3-phosphatidyltransferase